MRQVILALAIVTAGCSTQPGADSPVAGNGAGAATKTAATPADADMMTNVTGGEVHGLTAEDCRGMRGNPCEIGRRGTLKEPCFGLAGFLTGTDARPVYAAPSVNSRVLGTIPGATDDAVPSFDIIEGHDGWLRIDNAVDNSAINGSVERPMYRRKGWIRGEQAAVAAQAGRAFSAPDFASPVAIQLPRSSFDGADTVAIRGCEGSWVQARWRFRKGDPDRDYPKYWRPDAIVSPDPLVLQGWVTGVCADMYTTCDGVNGDRPPY